MREKLRGVVLRGQRLMKGWMEKDPLWSEILGVNFRSGSLNVYVSGDHQLFGQDIIPDCVRKIASTRSSAWFAGTILAAVHS